jgi:hypothetical protein
MRISHAHISVISSKKETESVLIGHRNKRLLVITNMATGCKQRDEAEAEFKQSKSSLHGLKVPSHWLGSFAIKIIFNSHDNNRSDTASIMPLQIIGGPLYRIISQPMLHGQVKTRASAYMAQKPEWRKTPGASAKRYK